METNNRVRKRNGGNCDPFLASVKIFDLVSFVHGVLITKNGKWTEV